MTRIDAGIGDLDTLDRLAAQDSPIHRLDPRAKAIATGLFLLTVVSFGKYDIAGLTPLFLYPAVLLTIGLVPMRVLLRYLLIACPFALLVGVFNPLLDREIVLRWGGIGVSGGWLSFGSILLRFLLTASAVLLLLACTGYVAVCAALGRLGAPHLLTMQFLMLYRFIFILTAEASRMVRAHGLRSLGTKRRPDTCSSAPTAGVCACMQPCSHAGSTALHARSASPAGRWPIRPLSSVAACSRPGPVRSARRSVGRMVWGGSGESPYRGGQESRVLLSGPHACPARCLVPHRARRIRGAGRGQRRRQEHLAAPSERLPLPRTQHRTHRGLSRHTLDAAQIRRSVGTVFQDPNDQLFMPTVEEDVAFGPLNLQLPPDEVEQRVVRSLEATNSLHLRQRPPYRLSGGEKRSVAIAAVLAMSPDILVMDEPTSGLDPRARRRLMDLLAGFTHTKIIASHDLDMILSLCPRTIVLHQGAVAADGPTASVLADQDLLLKSGLELPLSVQGCPVCGRGVATHTEG